MVLAAFLLLLGAVCGLTCPLLVLFLCSLLTIGLSVASAIDSSFELWHAIAFCVANVAIVQLGYLAGAFASVPSSGSRLPRPQSRTLPNH
jgi:hypothetical protein